MLSTQMTEEKLDPRVKRTRSLILQAFMELILDKGFQALTVQEIAQKAEINRATFYAHFPDKYALLDHSIRQMFRQEIEKRTLDACHYSQENLHALIVMVCEFVSDANSHCKPAQPQFESLVESQVKMQLKELLERWIEAESLPADAKNAATAASWAIYGLALRWSHEKSHSHLAVEDFADSVLPLIVANLRSAQPV